MAEQGQSGPQSGLPSVDRMAVLLGALAAGPASLAGLAEWAGLSDAAALRYLNSLAEHGLAEGDTDSRRYRVGMGLFVLGRAALSGRDFMGLAAAATDHLVDLVGETANLGARAGSEVVVVRAVESRQPIRKGAASGERDFWHSSGLGKAILSTMLSGQVADLLSGYEFTPFRLRTLTRLEDLARELDRVRDRGYAVDDEESAEGLRCVAVPVPEGRGTGSAARYGQSVSGPAARLRTDRLPGIARELTKQAEVLQTFLRPAQPPHLLPHRTPSRNGDERNDQAPHASPASGRRALLLHRTLRVRTLPWSCGVIGRLIVTFRGEVPRHHCKYPSLPGGSQMSVTLTSEQCKKFREDGFLIYGPLLSSAGVRAVGDRIDALAAGEAPGADRVGLRMEAASDSLEGVQRRDKTWQLTGVAEADDVIANIAAHPGIFSIIRQLMQTEEVSYLQDQVLMKPAHHGSHVSWHQDSGYWTKIEPWIDPPAIVTCWVAIDNVTEDNGCVRMVPGTHRLGVVLHERGGDQLLHVQGVDTAKAVPVVLPPGGVSFHHSCTVHGSAPNQSPNRRRGLALTYVRKDAAKVQ